jgi:ribosome-associated protein
MAANTRCHNVVVLDVSHVSPVTDFFVIATGTSPRQMRSAGEDIEEMGAPMGYKTFTRSGFEGESWILVDFIDVVVHVFSQDARMYYDLDNLWGDAKPVEWEPAKTA